MNEQSARRIVNERCGGRCERCGSAEGVTLHHRVKRSHGGSWAVENILGVCWPCHSFIELNPAWSHAQGFWLRAGQSAVSTPVWLWGRWVLLTADGGYAPHDTDI